MTSPAHSEAPEAESSAPRTLVTFPEWRGNPYQRMLSAEARDRGWQTRGTRFCEAFLDEIRAASPTTVLHVHSTAPITEGGADDADALRRAEVVAGELRQARERGAHVVWTVHNEHPHDARFVDAARRLQRELCELASVVHVLGRPDVVEALTGVRPRAVARIPHSSYLGVYGPRRRRSAARRALGAKPFRDAVLFFGRIRPYKGVELLLSAMERARTDGYRGQLLLAGKPSREVDLDGILGRLEGAAFPHTVVPASIPDEEVATWFSAADVMVVPYRRVLNSGSVELAATYGVPCILPRLPHLVDAFANEAWVRFYDIDDADASISELLRSGFHRSRHARRSARDHARRCTPQMMSSDFADLLDAMLARDTAGDAPR